MGLKEALRASRRYLLAIVSFTVLLVPILLHAVLGISLSPVLSGSMKPVFNTGDLLITQEVPANLLRVGDVVVIRNGEDYSLYAHRIVSIAETGRMLLIQTKGDANPTKDQGTLQIAADQLLPRGFGRLPWAGTLLNAVTRNKVSLLADFGLLALLSIGLNRFFFYRGHHRKPVPTQAPTSATISREKVDI